MSSLMFSGRKMSCCFVLLLVLPSCCSYCLYGLAVVANSVGFGVETVGFGAEALRSRAVRRCRCTHTPSITFPSLFFIKLLTLYMLATLPLDSATSSPLYFPCKLLTGCLRLIGLLDWLTYWDIEDSKKMTTPLGKSTKYKRKLCF